MSKKNDGNPQEARQRMHELYMAHQVHTLVNMMFQQLTAGRPAHQPWTSHAGDAFGSPPAMPPNMGCIPGAGAFGIAPTPGSPLVYWYP